MATSKKKLGSYSSISVILSITVALFLVGLSGILIIQAKKLETNIKENVEIQVFLNNSASDNDRISLEKILAQKNYIQIKESKPQIFFISREEAAKQFIGETGENFTKFLEDNPLRNSYIIKVKPAFYQAHAMKQIKKDIETINAVFEATYVENIITDINKNLNKVMLFLLGFTCILIITIVVLIHNTLKLALFSQRFLIRSMQLVGATARFIRKPFLKNAFIQGFISSLIAIIFLWLFLTYMETQIQELAMLRDTNALLMLTGSLIALGCLISILSAYRATTKYLKLSLDELY